MRLIDAEWITYVLRKIAQAEDKDLSKGEFGQGYVSGVYHAIHVIKSTEACLPKVCKHCHLVQYHDNNYCDRCGRLIDEAPIVEERKQGRWKNGCCTVCGESAATDGPIDYLSEEEQKYCWNCGAEMRDKIVK
jgi:hypothetical protein